MSLLPLGGYFLFVSFCAIYFRTYLLHGPAAWETAHFQKRARAIVDERMRGQLRETIQNQFPEMPEAERARMIDRRVEEILVSDRQSYDAVIRETAEKIREFSYPRYQKNYLLEADPYFYFGFTKSVVQTGRLGPSADRPGYFMNWKRRIPNGTVEWVNLHPYVGALCYFFMSRLNPRIDLMEGVAYLPLYLCLVVIALFFLLGKILGAGWPAATIGCFALVMSPIFIQRSCFGWYDTDPYNYIFPLAILCFFLAGTGQSKRFWLWALGSGFLTGLYALFWSGWPFIFLLMIAAALSSGIVIWLARRQFWNPYMIFNLWYAFFSVVFLMIFMHPRVFLDSLNSSLSVLPKFALAKFEVWPSVFLTVGETRSISFKKLIYLTGNYVTTGLAFTGFLGTFVYFAFQRDLRELSRWSVFMVLGIALMIMSIKVERFAILYVIPLSVFVMAGVEILMRLVKEVHSRLLRNRFSLQPMRFAAVAIIAAVFFPPSLVTAHAIGLTIHPIMDDTWYAAMVALRDKTPPHAVVQSWWSPGHFITGVAERSVSIDGASQHMRETYWIAKALVTDDPLESAGIFRMLNAGATDAVEYLNSFGIRTSRIVKSILAMVPLTREAARLRAPAELKPHEVDHLLTLTHGRQEPRATYVMIYNDLIEQNPALTIVATWDFEKAEAIVDREGGANPLSGLIPSKGSSRQPRDYLEKILPIMQVLRYTPEAGLNRREGEWFYFKNGLRVNLTTMESHVTVSEEKVDGRPNRLLMIRDGKLMEHQNTGDALLEISALVISSNDENRMTSVLADHRLIRSIMFRLYYLGGTGLGIFKPFFAKEDPKTGTRIVLYEIDWSAVEEGSIAAEKR